MVLVFSLGFLITPVFAEDTQCGKVPCATTVSDCGSKEAMVNGQAEWTTPSNCLYLDEPIGGKPGFDLYTVACENIDKQVRCITEKWNGGQILPGVRGPIQAVLTSQAGKEYQGPFGLLYGYLSLIYTYMSGLIIGIAVLFVVVGGIQIATAGGESEGVNKGKKRIIQAITGVILWFTASLILYTINPTFFTISQS